MKAAMIVGLAAMLAPRAALACATCIGSPFGQTSNWPYLGLILLPFGLIVTIAGILGYCAYLGAREDPLIIKETT